MRNIATVLLLACAALPWGAAAQDADGIAEVRAELERLKAEQAARAAEMQRLEARLAALEAAARNEGNAPAPAPVLADGDAEPASRLEVSGDVRLRYESNTGDQEDWDRGALRARLGARYAANDWLTVGGRLATGDPDNPRSVDVTLSDFADDFDVSIDQAWARATIGRVELWGGKFPLPFRSTGLVWDGDVNPQGIGATWKQPAGPVTLRAAGLYFLVDHSVAGTDSSMVGAQLGLELPLADGLALDLAGARYDYSLSGLAGGDADDFRTNLIGPDGRYVSDFDLVEAIASVRYAGFERWPLTLTGQYVTNRGARTPGDTAYLVGLTAGALEARGDWRLDYAYSVAEVDAVLAAFSHDDTTIGTNYRQHTLSVNYALRDNVLLDATLYRYRPYDTAFLGPDDPDDWLDRLRLHFQVRF